MPDVPTLSSRREQELLCRLPGRNAAATPWGEQVTRYDHQADMPKLDNKRRRMLAGGGERGSRCDTVSRLGSVSRLWPNRQ